ncbi:MAG: D-alanyl-D-alanine carboxypeptidase [Ruminococcaceae bacterium]|nr:D-alanyl-D-alanine carboxypeptidase [Oscillospiraceae bacterium]
MNKLTRLLIPILCLILVLSLAAALLLSNNETASPAETTERNTEEEPSDTQSNDSDSDSSSSIPPATADTDPPITTGPPQTTEEPITTEAPATTEEPTLPPLAFTAPDKLLASQIFVYDVSADVFLYEKGTESPILPASITKILTALYALEVCPADTLFYPKEEVNLIGAGSSVAYIKTHHVLTLEMLIEGMLLPSGNDAAYVVAAGTARYLTGNDSMRAQEALAFFMEKANEYAKSLGCTDTHFRVPDGLAYDNHYTSAHDLVILGKAALANPIIMRYASTATERVTYASGHTITWNNTNQLIQPTSPYYSPYVTGLKTGSLTNHYCLLVSADIGERTFLIGLFGAPNNAARYQDATALLKALTAMMSTGQ